MLYLPCLDTSQDNTASQNNGKHIFGYVCKPKKPKGAPEGAFDSTKSFRKSGSSFFGETYTS